MTPIVCWFDPVSPYAWLAFERMPQALAGLSYAVEYRPVLFAALLKHHGHKGPAEIDAKREWTYRQVDWLARTHGVRLERPEPHPFNPLALLRLALAMGEHPGQMPNRRVVERLMHHAWCAEGADPNGPTRLAALRQELAPPRDPNGDEVKAELRALTDQAVARGVFGVPTFEALGRLYWGLDALPMLREDMLAAAASSDPGQSGCP
jgi:2-hydroxychromene-2-carboxylate isomerase